MSDTIYAKLKPIAKAHLKAYEADFYTHDKHTCRMMKAGETWVWVCRDHGTHLQIINGPADAEWLTMQDLALSWDMLDALRDMGDAIKAVCLIETTAPRHGTVTRLDSIPPRPAALVGVEHGKKLFS